LLAAKEEKKDVDARDTRGHDELRVLRIDIK